LPDHDQEEYPREHGKRHNLISEPDANPSSRLNSYCFVGSPSSYRHIVNFLGGLVL
jgi:hypothetical protein